MFSIGLLSLPSLLLLIELLPFSTDEIGVWLVVALRLDVAIFSASETETGFWT